MKKTVLVTGSSRGIGRAVALKFASCGYHVVINCARSTERMEEVKKEVETLGAECLAVQADVGNPEDCKRLFQEIGSRFGHVDVLVNNAGINIPRLLVDPKDPEGEFELDEAVWNKVQSINLNGVFLCAQAAARQMVAKNDGVIINMSSESGLEGSEGQSVYAATKAAVNSLTRSWCKELGKYNVRVVGVAPGIMEATGLRTLAYESALSYTRVITVDELRA